MNRKGSPVEKKRSETNESISTQISENVFTRLKPQFDHLNLSDWPVELLMVGLKEEQLLEVYAKKEGRFKLLKSYPFSANSGLLGPKLREGDLQIPEGIYKVEYLNPNSSFYLSMRLNYPNEFDKSKTKLENEAEMGGDIFIHGKAMTVGCIPVGDEAIEELFMLVKHALQNEIKVIISPRDFRLNTEFPKIEGIDWEEELYEIIQSELNQIKK